MLGPAQHHRARGRDLDLVLVHEVQPERARRRVHPGLAPVDGHPADAGPPPRRRPDDATAQRVGQELVAEADAGERHARVVDPAHEA